MADVRIITDVTAHLAPELIAKHRIAVLPVEIQIGDETFLIKPGDSQQRLFERMAEGPAKPTEASISPTAFEEAYGRLNRETEEILVIASSSKLSDGYSVAHRAARTFMGRCRITVLDSMSTSWGLGHVVETAAAAAARGHSLDEIVRLVRGLLPHLYFVFFVERLDYLTTPGYLDGPGGREKAGYGHGGPACVISDAALLRFDEASKEMYLDQYYPGATPDEIQGRTGYPLDLSRATPLRPPTAQELRILRQEVDPQRLIL